MGVGKRIKEIADQKGMSIRKVANIADLPYNTVYSIVKRNSSRIEPETLNQIARALGVHRLELSEGQSASYALRKGEVVSQLLEKTGRTLQQLSDETSIEVGRLQDFISSANVNMQADELKKICDFLDVTIDDLTLMQFPTNLPESSKATSGEERGELISGVDDAVNNQNLNNLLESFSKLNSNGQEEAVRSVKIIAGNPAYRKDNENTEA